MLRITLALAGLIVLSHGALGQQVYVGPPGVVIEPRPHYVPPPPVVYCDRECQWRRDHWRHEHERYYDHRDWR